MTEIADNRLWFRGLDALDLAWDWDFEDVCELLWDVRPDPAGPASPGPPAGSRRWAVPWSAVR